MTGFIPDMIENCEKTHTGDTTATRKVRPLEAVENLKKWR